MFFLQPCLRNCLFTPSCSTPTFTLLERTLHALPTSAWHNTLTVTACLAPCSQRRPASGTAGTASGRTSTSTGLDPPPSPLSMYRLLGLRSNWVVINCWIVIISDEFIPASCVPGETKCFSFRRPPPNSNQLTTTCISQSTPPLLFTYFCCCTVHV